MAAHRHHHQPSRNAPYTQHHHHAHSHPREREYRDSYPIDEPSIRKWGSRMQAPDESSFLPSNDRTEWYYPAARQSDIAFAELTEETRDEIALAASSSGQGNWGNKLVKGARWMRRGKIVAWGPSKAEWDMEDKARKRLKQVMPRSRSPSPPPLPTMRPSTPPLTASYNQNPTIHRDFASFVLDPSVQHSYTSTHIAMLQDTATELIAGEASMRRSFGAFWRVLQGDLERCDTLYNTDDIDDKTDAHMEDEGDDDVRIALRNSQRGANGSSHVDATPVAYQFVSNTPVTLSVAATPGHSGGERTFSPEDQLNNLNWCLGVLQELAGDGKEYISRLEEIRNGLGQADAVRRSVWEVSRRTALTEMPSHASR